MAQLSYLRSLSVAFALALFAPLNAVAADPTPDPAEPCVKAHGLSFLHDAGSDIDVTR